LALVGRVLEYPPHCPKAARHKRFSRDTRLWAGTTQQGPLSPGREGVVGRCGGDQTTQSIRIERDFPDDELALRSTAQLGRATEQHGCDTHRHCRLHLRRVVRALSPTHPPRMVMPPREWARRKSPTPDARLYRAAKTMEAPTAVQQTRLGLGPVIKRLHGEPYRKFESASLRQSVRVQLSLLTLSGETANNGGPSRKTSALR
jgi:hypothetical protein